MYMEDLSDKERATIKRTSKKYDIKPKILSYILKKFKSFEDFTKCYIEALNSKNPIDVTKRLGSKRNTVQYFELTSSNIIGRNSTYGKLFKAILDTKYGFTVEGSIEQSLKKAVEEELSSNIRNYNIVLDYFGIDRPKLTLEEIATRYGMTRQRVDQIKKRAIEVLRNNPDVQLLMKRVLNEDYSRKAIVKVADMGDIFVKDENSANYTKRENFLLEYYSQEIDTLEFSKDCFEQLRIIQGKIEENILGAGRRRKILAKVKDKKKQFMEEHTSEITQMYEEKIEGIKDNYAYNARILIETFGRKIYDIFRENDIKTMAQLVSLSVKDILDIKGISKNDITVIFEKLQEYGYTIPEDETISLKETYCGDKSIQTSSSEYMDGLKDSIKKSGLPVQIRKGLLNQATATREEQIQKIMNYFQYRMTETVLDVNMKTTIDDSSLPSCIQVILLKLNIKTLEDLMKMSRYKIEMMRGLGESKAKRIYDIIRSFGYDIPEDDRDISFKRYNAGLMEIDGNTINAGEVAQEILESELSDDEKSELLDILYKNTIEKLKGLYAEYERKRTEYLEAAEEMFDQTLKTKQEIEIDQISGELTLKKARMISEMQEVIQTRIKSFEGYNTNDGQDER